ncbi:MAG: hypothetical protein IH983_07810 [Planctomycetes bacterium]|nr:hypothetical protein [Planctomycetota bacterium]
MEKKDVPVLELAAEYRTETRSYRRNLVVVIIAIVGFGALYLIPYVALQHEELNFLAAEASLVRSLERNEANLRSLDQARGLLADYQADLESRSIELAQEGKKNVQTLNGLLKSVANPPDIGGFEFQDQITAQVEQANAPPLSPQMLIKNLTVELFETYGLDTAAIEVLTNPSAAGNGEWRRVADEVLNRIMAAVKGELRAYARERAQRLAESVRALEPALPSDLLDVEHLGESIVVPDDSAPRLTATPSTTRGKDMIMAAEFAHIRVPSSDLESQLRVRAGDMETMAVSVERQRTELAAEVETIRVEKAELEASMEKTASELQSFVLPFGVLEWNASRLTMWFPTLAVLLLCYLAITGARLDRQRTALRQHLKGLTDLDRTLVTGPPSLARSALAIFSCATFVLYLQYVIGVERWWMLALVGGCCASSVVVVMRRLAKTEAALVHGS